jgi:hypothetical protein
MKESKNLKASSSNILVGLYLDKIEHEGQLNEIFFGLASQTHAVDVVVLDAGLSDKELEVLTKTAKEAEVRMVKTHQEGETPEEEVVKSKNSVNLSIVKTSVSNFSKVFNDVFNLALENEYEAFSVIESGDAVSAKWFAVANTFMQENEEIGFFLPMVKNWQNGALSGLLNEACWAEGISEEAGKFDMNLLLRYNCANPLGGLYRVSDLEEYSEEKDGRFYPMKESVKISHYYEFFLRMIYNDVKMMTVPRIGYEFRVRNTQAFNHSSSKVPGNITAIAPEKGGVAPGEVSFWMDLAKKEYFFDEDRNKSYEQEPEKV